jgi:hypothetical protein
MNAFPTYVLITPDRRVEVLKEGGRVEEYWKRFLRNSLEVRSVNFTLKSKI